METTTKGVSTWNYTYDNLNRLSTAQDTVLGMGCQESYDSFGNRRSQMPYGGSCTSPSFSFTPNNQINGYCYDAAGNLLDSGPCPATGVAHQFAYDAENRLISSAQGAVTYVYGADGMRATKQTSSGITNYVYDFDGSLVAKNEGGIWGSTQYVSAGGDRLGIISSIGLASASVKGEATDWLGTERLRADASSNVLGTFSSLPFGDALTTTAGTDGFPIHFTGKERDAESGLDYFGARYYSSSMGRFMSPDPKAPSIKTLMNPQKWNRYTFVLNNPLSLVDPDGLEEITVQLRAYIQAHTVSDPIGRTFAGDSRGPTSSQGVSSRSTITVRIETDPSIRPGNPIISQTSSAGTTHQIGADGKVVGSATATQGLPTASGTRDASGNPVLNIQQDVKNPMEPQSLTPGIRSDLNVTVSGSSITTAGTVSGTPSFELNVSTAGGATPIFHFKLSHLGQLSVRDFLKTTQF